MAGRLSEASRSCWDGSKQCDGAQPKPELVLTFPLAD